MPPEATIPKDEWDLVVEPKSSLFSLNFKEVWRYKDLLLLMVRRDFVAYYKQTILGPIWFFLQPLLTTAMYFLIFLKWPNYLQMMCRQCCFTLQA